MEKFFMLYFRINFAKNIINSNLSGVIYTKIESLLKIKKLTGAHYPFFPYRFRDIKEIKSELGKEFLMILNFC
jgi:hypothetical protein